MASRLTRSQTAHAADSSSDHVEAVIEFLFASLDTIFFQNQMKMNPRIAQIQKAFSQPKLNLSNDETEFQKLKKTKKRAHRTQNMKRLRDRERQKWAPLMFISIRNADSTTIGSLFLDADTDKQLRAERYFDITITPSNTTPSSVQTKKKIQHWSTDQEHSILIEIFKFHQILKAWCNSYRSFKKKLSEPNGDTDTWSFLYIHFESFKCNSLCPTMSAKSPPRRGDTAARVEWQRIAEKSASSRAARLSKTMTQLLNRKTKSEIEDSTAFTMIKSAIPLLKFVASFSAVEEHLVKIDARLTRIKINIIKTTIAVKSYAAATTTTSSDNADFAPARANPQDQLREMKKLKKRKTVLIKITDEGQRASVKMFSVIV